VDTVVALDAASGATAWTAPGASVVQPLPPRACAVSAARRLVCSGPVEPSSLRPDSFAVDLASGSTVWASADCGGPVIAAGPDGAVYCAADAALVAIDAGRGVVAWTLDISPLCAAGVPARVLGAAAVLPTGALIVSVQCSTNSSADTPGRLDEGFILALAPTAPPSPSPSPSPGAAGPLSGVWAAGDHGDAQRDGRAAAAPPRPLSGAVAWSVNMGDSGYAARGGLAFDGRDTLYAERASLFGINAGVFAINTTSGAVRWRYESASCSGFMRMSSRPRAIAIAASANTMA
jgi:outer membrane protein assembly factor BamB